MLRRPVANFLYRMGHILLIFGAWANRPAACLFRLCARLWPEHKDAIAWYTYLQGIAAFHRGDFQLALEQLKIASQKLPEIEGIRGNLGLLYAFNGLYERAIQYIEAVFRDHPRMGRESNLWVALIWSYLHTGRVPNALSAIERAASAKSFCARLELLALLTSGTAMGNVPVADIEKHLCLIPSSAPMVLEYIQYLAGKNEYDLAHRFMQALPETSRGWAYIMIAQAALEEDDLTTALWAVQLAENVHNDIAAAALIRSEISLRRGRCDAAVDEAKKALEHASADEPETYEQLGRVFLVQGRWGEAAEQMIEALHTGAASALAAGVAALAAIGVGDYKTAKGLFCGERTGDTLGVACAHVAQCRIMEHGQHYDEAMKLAGRAMDAIEEFPAWAATAGVIHKLVAELELCLSNVDVDETGLRRLNGLKKRLDEIRSRAFSVVE